MTSRPVLLLAVFLATYVILVATSIRAYPGGPDPAVTGGFGELTCNQSGCHTSYELNAGRISGLGDLLISGLPERYEPSETYPITLLITHTQDRGHWGFQLAARVNATGEQAGELQPIDGTTQVLEDNGIQYIEHTMEGIPTNTFNFNWLAPTGPVGEIIMHAAGNAADGDVSPEGDYTYSASVTLSPAR